MRREKEKVGWEEKWKKRKEREGHFMDCSSTGLPYLG